MLCVLSARNSFVQYELNMSDEITKNGWNEWSKVVLNELERLTESNNKLANEMQEFKIEVAKEIASKKEVDLIREEITKSSLEHTKEINSVKGDLESKFSKINNYQSIQIAKLETELKIKAGVWGAVGSLLGVVIMVAISML